MNTVQLKAFVKGVLDTSFCRELTNIILISPELSPFKILLRKNKVLEFTIVFIFCFLDGG